MKKLLHWITGMLPCRIISLDGSPYLERYYVGQAFGTCFYLHRFVGSDPAKELHDHPWAWAYSLVLSGSYTEETRAGLRQVRFFNRINGLSFHRVLMNQGETCWTLFFHPIKKTKQWGFLYQSKSTGISTWVPHDALAQCQESNEKWWLTAPTGSKENKRSAA